MTLITKKPIRSLPQHFVQSLCQEGEEHFHQNEKQSPHSPSLLNLGRFLRKTIEIRCFDSKKSCCFRIYPTSKAAGGNLWECGPPPGWSSSFPSAPLRGPSKRPSSPTPPASSGGTYPPPSRPPRQPPEQACVGPASPSPLFSAFPLPVIEQGQGVCALYVLQNAHTIVIAVFLYFLFIYSLQLSSCHVHQNNSKYYVWVRTLVAPSLALGPGHG